ncbi:MAG: hypothetical protein K6T78_09305 [Alicyclobacillus sp.]|nr:hypothetical protein [Alicyclobacillus sp.]
MNSRSWKPWLVVGALVVVLAAAATGLALWNNLDSEWQVEAAAAQYALDNSPISKITGHDVFTGADAQEVFYGTDPFGRPWVSFVYGTPFTVHSVPAQGLLTKQRVLELAKARGLKVGAAHLGFLDAAAQQRLGVQTDVVWEVYGQTGPNQTQYVYFDARTGKEVQSY